MELFKLFGSIFIDTDAAEKSMQKVEQAAEKLGSKLEKYGKGISDMGGKLTKTVTAGVTALGTASVVSASSFEDAMAKVSTIADESEMSMDDMRAAILGLSDQTGISAVAIAEDVYNAISAGQKTADAVNFVSNSTKLARAGFAETSQSLDVLTTIMNAYGMEAEDVTRVSDVLIQTQNLGKTTVADLSSSMGKVIPTAKAQGVELEALCGAYAVMTANGIATAETTTYLNSMLNELGKQGSSAAVAFAKGTEHIKEGGLTMSEAMESGWGLTDVLSILDEQACISGTSISNMFGSAEAGKAAAVLWDDAQKLNGAIEEMGTSAGSTETAFGKLETTSFKAQKAINEAKNVLVDLGGTIIEMLVPYLEKGAEKVHEFAEWFKGLDDGTKELIVKIGLLVAAVGPLLTIFGKGVSVIGNVVSIGGKLAGGIKTLVSTGSKLGDGVKKIMGLLSNASSFTTGTLWPAIRNFGGLLSSGASKVFGLFTSGITKMGGLLTGGVTKVIGFIGSIGSSVTGTLIPAIASISGPVLVVIGVIAALVAAGVALYKNWDEICEWASKAWGAIKDTIGGAIDGIKGFFGGLLDFAKGIWDSIYVSFIEGGAGIAGVVEVVFDGIVDLFKGGMSLISNLIGIDLSGITERVVSFMHDIRNRVVDFVHGLEEKFKDLVSNIGEKFSALKEKAVSKITELKDKVVDKFNELKDKAVEKIMSLKDKAVDKFEELKGAAAEKISSLKESVVSGIEEMKDNASLKVSEMKEKIVTGFQDMKERAADKFNDLKEKWSGRFSAAREKIVSEAEEIREKVGSKLSQMRDKAVDRISNLAEKAEAGFGKLKEKGLAAAAILKEKVSGSFAEMGTAIFSKFEGFGEKMSSIFSGAHETVKGIVDKIKGFMDFDWKLPKIKLPHFSVEWDKGGMLGTLASAMGLPGMPKLGVEWYRKAMDAPMIMDRPTAFGINRSGQVMAGGEAGSEVVSGTETLMEMISAAVAEENARLYDLLERICELLAAYLPACASKQLVLDTGALVGELAGPLDERLGWKRHMDGRLR